MINFRAGVAESFWIGDGLIVAQYLVAKLSNLWPVLVKLGAGLAQKAKETAQKTSTNSKKLHDHVQNAKNISLNILTASANCFWNSLQYIKSSSSIVYSPDSSTIMPPNHLVNDPYFALKELRNRRNQENTDFFRLFLVTSQLFPALTINGDDWRHANPWQC